jgi:transposase
LKKTNKEGAMNQLTAHGEQYTRNQADLYLAFELSNKEWKLGFTVGFGQRPRERTVLAGDPCGVKREVELAKRRFEFPREDRVLRCYEAGRDGFWLHRYLVHLGVRNLVVDSSSVEMNRRARRANTDRMDLGKLLSMLMRYDNGERKLWSVVRVPTVYATIRRRGPVVTSRGDAEESQAQNVGLGEFYGFLGYWNILFQMRPCLTFQQMLLLRSHKNPQNINIITLS